MQRGTRETLKRRSLKREENHGGKTRRKELRQKRLLHGFSNTKGLPNCERVNKKRSRAWLPASGNARDVSTRNCRFVVYVLTYVALYIIRVSSIRRSSLPLKRTQNDQGRSLLDVRSISTRSRSRTRRLDLSQLRNLNDCTIARVLCPL